jgi:hypothetical protein
VMPCITTRLRKTLGTSLPLQICFLS